MAASLAPGVRLGVYEVVGPLGAGGMGEVYRARDTKLGRDVALKILPEAFASDPERLARFEREARTLAALNHPSIAHIHGLEDSDGTRAIVMELVDGEDLSARIASGPIPLDEAIAIARKIADALEAAHEQGIVHRDLKPANIKVRADGSVKVLDFGLAKALDGAGGAGRAGGDAVLNSPTITSPAMTAMGMILGTAAYMSPEQAKGRPVDKRSDLWSFGCVLFEMLTGTRAFPGDDVSETLASVLKSEPPWERLPADTPVTVHLLLRQCLRRDPQQRLASAGAARLDLEDALNAPGVPRPVAGGVSRRKWFGIVLATAAIVAVAVTAAVLITRARTAAALPTRQAARLAIPLDAGVELANAASVAISPDGSLVAYVGVRSGINELYLRPLDAVAAKPVAGSRGALAPFFSPDGKSIAFFANNTLKKMDVASGVIRTIADNTGTTQAGIWRRNGTIVFRAAASPMIVEASGGAARPLFEHAPADVFVEFVDILPDDQTALTLIRPRSAVTTEEIAAELLDLTTGERKPLVRPASYARYLATGHVLFVRNGVVSAARLDAATKTLVGAPVRVFDGVRQQVFTGVAALSCSQTGTCVYVAGAIATARTLSIVDRNGTARVLPLPGKSYANPRFSPDGARLVWQIEQLTCDTEIYDLERGAVTRLTTDSDNHFPTWTRDGSRVTSVSRKAAVAPIRYSIVSRPANGSGAEEPAISLSEDVGPSAVFSWSPGGALAFDLRGDIWIQEPAGKAHPFFTTPTPETAPAFSPDGKWLAYVSAEAGHSDVYVRPFPGPGEKYAVSTSGGGEPVWSRDGRELFYRTNDQMMAVDVQSSATFSASRPRVLFTGNFFTRGRAVPEYDVNARGEFVMLNSNEDDRAATQINVLTDWFDTLRRLVP